eukprot:3105041-Amphidinium_carterae.1
MAVVLAAQSSSILECMVLIVLSVTAAAVSRSALENALEVLFVQQWITRAVPLHNTEAVQRNESTRAKPDGTWIACVLPILTSQLAALCPRSSPRPFHSIKLLDVLEASVNGFKIGVVGTDNYSQRAWQWLAARNGLLHFAMARLGLIPCRGYFCGSTSQQQVILRSAKETPLLRTTLETSRFGIGFGHDAIGLCSC